MTETPLSLGKLPARHLSRLLARLDITDPDVVLGPGIGRDAAAISFGDRCLVAKTDPITFATQEIGRYAVHVNANDIACTGGRARWFLATLLLPEGRSDAQMAQGILDQITSACRDLDIELVGGHTEITHGLDRPIVAGCMLGEVALDRLVRPEDARPGDALILTKGIAIEGTAIIAWEKGDELPNLDEALLARSRDLLHDPGISVVRDAGVAVAAGGVHALHDPTEGGLATGLEELATAAGVGLEIDEGAIPILAETQALCEPLKLNPLGLIASGSLLIAADSKAASGIVAALTAAGIPGTQIGAVVTPEDGIVLKRDGEARPLPRFERDEIAKLFE